MIHYSTNKKISADAYISLLKSNTLGERRPLNDKNRIEKMLENADLVVSAWDGGELVGVARSVTDFVYCCYLSDLSVRGEYQHQGIGIELIRQTRKCLQEGTSIILLAAPQAYEYYPHIGFTKHPSAWVLRYHEDI